MQERIIEIVMFLLSEIRRTKKPLGELDIHELEDRGYSQAEITSAFSWIHERYSGDPASRTEWTARSGSFRILHPAERMVISPEAYGYLLQLHALGMVTQEDVEVVVERSMMSGLERITVPEIQSIVMGMLFDGDFLDAARSRPLYLTSDTIH
jgi:uncharacterized protein Smg (DUF494 family)